jgi:hypothetical protein
VIYSRTMSIFKRASKLISLQREVITRKNEEIATLQRCVLFHQMGYIDLVTAWRESLKHPDVDLEDDLDRMLAELRDNLSQSQEFVI